MQTTTNSKKTLSSQKGFTLVEIMIVLVILGGLMALLVPSVTGQRDKANVRMTKISMGKVSTALESFYGDCNQYPTSLDQLLQKPSEDVCDNWGPTAYIRGNKDIRDAWNRDFMYEVEGGGFVLKSFGKDGQEGGEGYDEDISFDDI